jgi:hypothetical protein
VDAWTVLGLVLSVVVGISLGFFGGGGSILTVPLFAYVFGLDAKQAIASSLLVVGAASVSAAFLHWRAGNVRVRTGLFFGAAGMAGSYLGGRAAAYFDGALLLVLFGVMMAFTSIAMWRGRRVPLHPTVAHSPLRLLAQGASVGSLTGLVGAGGGFLIVPALALWAGLPVPAAVGTSLFVIVLNTVAGFAGYASHVAVHGALVASVALMAVVGTVLGALLSRRVSPLALRKGFAGFVLVMAALVLVREADTWVGVARESLPESGAQVGFSLVLLAAGLLAGRASRRAGHEPLSEPMLEHGAGI